MCAQYELEKNFGVRCIFCPTTNFESRLCNINFMWQTCLEPFSSSTNSTPTCATRPKIYLQALQCVLISILEKNSVRDFFFVLQQTLKTACGPGFPTDRVTKQTKLRPQSSRNTSIESTDMCFLSWEVSTESKKEVSQKCHISLGRKWILKTSLFCMGKWQSELRPEVRGPVTVEEKSGYLRNLRSFEFSLYRWHRRKCSAGASLLSPVDGVKYRNMYHFSTEQVKNLQQTLFGGMSRHCQRFQRHRNFKSARWALLTTHISVICVFGPKATVCE